jgi:5-methylcytosine-specific restriction endonuclease McrA
MIRSARPSSTWKKSAYRRIAARDGEQCAVCTIGNKMSFTREGYLQKSLHVDHVTALRSGGSNHDDNLQLLCDFCHKKKTAREQAEIARRRWDRSGLQGYAQVLL